MPRGDGTGPLGEGPMTGRAAGYCAGYPTPGFANHPGFSRVGVGRGGGWGRGGGLGRGGGWGHRNRFYATGVPFSAYNTPGSMPAMEREEEMALLKSESERLTSVLENIRQRLEQLSAKNK